MRPVSSVSLRPPHSMDLRLMSNMSVDVFLLSTRRTHFPRGVADRGGTAFLSSRDRGSSPSRRVERGPSFRALGRACGLAGPLIFAAARLGRDESLLSAQNPARGELSAQAQRVDQGLIARLVGR